MWHLFLACLISINVGVMPRLSVFVECMRGPTFWYVPIPGDNCYVTYNLDGVGGFPDEITVDLRDFQALQNDWSTEWMQ